MLIPAHLHLAELDWNFCKMAYSDEWFYVISEPGFRSIEVRESNDTFYWVTTKKVVYPDGTKDEIVTGYFSYKICYETRSVENLVMISFDKGNQDFLKDVYNKIQELMKIYDRLEFRATSGNPVERHYDRFIKKFGGNKVVLHNKIADGYGKLHDDLIYEILLK